MGKIYVANLEAYNNGELIGKWVSLPQDSQELEATLETIANVRGYVDSELAIHDVDGMPFIVGEWDNILDVNEKMEQLEKYSELEFMKDLIADCGLDRALEIVESGDYHDHANCETMADVAEEYVTGYTQLDDFALRYFDFEKFGRDLYLEGYFVEYNGPTTSGFIEILK